MINLKINNLQKDFPYQSKSIEHLCSEILITQKYEHVTLMLIFCDDIELNKLKIKYFNEDVLTDVLAFPFKNNTELEAEIYISIDRAKENSKQNNVTLNNEIIRLIIHALLHLFGYNDYDQKSKKIMFQKQEELVSKFANIDIL
jgi:rRNA maturation RNase YbeY